MKALCENDAARGRGHVRFCCAEVTNLNAQYSFSLCRASDQTFLGRTGWQNAEEQHSPEGQSVEGDRLVLNVGPSIVDNLDENENYRLSLHAPELAPQRAAFSIAQINRSLRDAAGSVQMSTAAAAPQPAPEPQPLPPTPEEAPIVAPEPQQQKSALPLVLAAVLVLALAGGGLWWYMQKNTKAEQTATAEQAQPAEKKDEAKPEPEKNKPEPDKAPEKAEPAPAPKAEADKAEADKAEAKPAPDQAAEQAAEQAAAQPAPQPAPVLAPRERVRQYLGGSPSASGAMQMADELLAGPEGTKPDTQDSVYRLHYYAKQQGDANATLGLARSADPTQPAWGSLPKNAAEAWMLYAAAAPQKPEAAQALQGLKQWLEAEAAKGNKQALGWIEEIGRASK